VELLDGLQSLIDKSLLYRVEDSGGEPRFKMLETIWEYAQEQLMASGEAEALQQRHAEYYLALVEAAELELTGVHQAVWLARLEAEHDNLRAALQWLLDQREVDLSLHFTGALWRFWPMHGHLSEGRRWLDAALGLAGRGGPARTAGAAPPQPDTGRRAAQALNGAGVLAYTQGDFTAAHAFLQESLALFRELGDTWGIAYALNGLGLVANDQGDYARARALFEESLAMRRELGNTWGIAASLNNLGLVAKEQGDYARARALFEESLALKCELGDTWGTALALSNLGLVAKEQGDYARARALYEESLALFRELGDTQNIAYALSGLGNVAYAQGDYTAARALHAESLALRRELGDKHGIAESLERFAAVASAQGQAERALRLAGAAAALREAISAPLSPIDQAALDRWLAPARQALSEATCTAAWEAGRKLTLEQATAEALDEGTSGATLMQ
jgi:tetratricopeptide (TPR) repeat protein